MTLINTALLCEAQTFIEYFKLKKINSNPKIYTNNSLLILISNIGKINTINSLEYIFKNYTITKAINIGIAGCNNNSIDIGELFCCNKKSIDIKYLPLKTVDIAQTLDTNHTDTLLYDMEAKYFISICTKYINEEAIFVFKIVSDHLSKEILSKDFIKSLIKNSNVISKLNLI